MNNNKKTLLNVPVDVYQPEEFILKIEEELQHPGVKTIFAINPEKVMQAQKDTDLFSALREADFLIPDGIGTVIGVWILYGKKIFRMTGIKFMDSLLKVAMKKDLRVFIYGARPHVNKIASEKILKLYPSLNLVGIQHGYLLEDKYNDLIKRINRVKADILFVGLGSPKQEKWIQNYKKILEAKICIGIGGSLDVFAGNTQRAPFWLQKVGLEWLYRLINEPARFKRQKNLLKFAFGILKEKICT